MNVNMVDEVKEYPVPLKAVLISSIENLKEIK